MMGDPARLPTTAVMAAASSAVAAARSARRPWLAGDGVVNHSPGGSFGWSSARAPLYAPNFRSVNLEQVRVGEPVLCQLSGS